MSKKVKFEVELIDRDNAIITVEYEGKKATFEKQKSRYIGEPQPLCRRVVKPLVWAAEDAVKEKRLPEKEKKEKIVG